MFEFDDVEMTNFAKIKVVGIDAAGIAAINYMVGKKYRE